MEIGAGGAGVAGVGVDGGDGGEGTAGEDGVVAGQGQGPLSSATASATQYIMPEEVQTGHNIPIACSISIVMGAEPPTTVISRAPFEMPIPWTTV